MWFFFVFHLTSIEIIRKRLLPYVRFGSSPDSSFRHIFWYFISSYVAKRCWFSDRNWMETLLVVSSGRD